MKVPEEHNKKNLPSELDSLLHDLSSSEVEGLKEAWDLSATQEATDGFPDENKLSSIWNVIDSEVSKGEAEQERKPARRLERAPDRLRRPNSKGLPLYKVQWIAIAATVLVGAIGIVFWFSPVSITAPYGEIASLTLDDGSRIELNSGATLEYPRRFGAERKVVLDGEAYFDVAKDQKPFVVETFNSSVRVLGTRFNVRAWSYDSSAKTLVALESGKVQLTDRQGGEEAVILEPGHSAAVEGAQIKLSEKDSAFVASSLAWRKGGFFFSDERVSSIIDEIERRFNADITLTPATLGNKRVKYSYTNSMSIDVIIEDLSASLGLQYREVDNGYEVYEPR